MQITTIGIDLAKNVFQIHGADQRGKAVLRRQLRRDQVAPFEAGLLRGVLTDWHQPADVCAVSASRTAQSARVRVFIDRLRDERRRQHGDTP